MRGNTYNFESTPEIQFVFNCSDPLAHLRQEEQLKISDFKVPFSPDDHRG